MARTACSIAPGDVLPPTRFLGYTGAELLLDDELHFQVAKRHHIFHSISSCCVRRRIHVYLSRLRTTAKMSLAQVSHDLDISKTSPESRFSTLEQMVHKAKESVTGSHASDVESSVQYSQRSRGKAGSMFDSGGSPTVASSKYTRH